MKLAGSRKFEEATRERYYQKPRREKPSMNILVAWTKTGAKP